MNMNLTPLIILSGPTSVGKTGLSISLAKAFNGEIISADSMQVYRGMDIGTAKITIDEMQGVRHHLIDILDPDEEFSVADFKNLAKAAIKDIVSRGKLPIVVGGTGFYIQALLYDVDFESGQGPDTKLRLELEDIALKNGPDILFERLREIDPKTCEIIHKNNIKKVIRAIEYYEQTGHPISEHNKEMHAKESDYNFAYFVLNDDREKVYARIDERVDIMLSQGLINEVTLLNEKGFSKGLVSMQGLGYKEILEYLDGNCSLDEAIYKIKRDTKHFAKRQITWFKREKEVIWINKDEFNYDNNQILDYMKGILNEKGILS